MCCGYEAWNAADSFCFLMYGGVTETQTEDLESATFSSQVFQYTEVDECMDCYEEEWVDEEWEDEEWDEDWEDEEYWEDMWGCDFESYCWVSIGSTHFFCREE